jgi:hypothetical protein
MEHTTDANGSRSFGDQVRKATDRQVHPIQEDGGLPCALAADVPGFVDQHLAVVPTIPWPHESSSWPQNVANFNAQIARLCANYPVVVRDPDLWTFFKNNSSLIGSSDVHPTSAGYAAYRQQWFHAMSPPSTRAARLS